jgi:hypothetical protein
MPDPLQRFFRIGVVWIPLQHGQTSLELNPGSDGFVERQVEQSQATIFLHVWKIDMRHHGTHNDFNACFAAIDKRLASSFEARFRKS